MENFFYLLVVVVVAWLIVFLEPKPLKEGQLEETIAKYLQSEKILNEMNFLISEVGRISKEKTTVIKAHDWDQLKKLHEEEDRNKITFQNLTK